MRGIPSRIPLRHALHLPTFSTIVPWVVVLSAVGAVDTLDLAVVATWLTIHTLTLLAAGTPLIVAKLILHWRGVQDLSILWLVVGGVMAGLVKGSLTAMAEWQLGLIESWPEVALWRSIGASVAAVWLLVLIAVARTGLSQLEASRQRLVRQNVAARLTAEPGYDIAHLDEPLEKVVSLRDEVAGHFRLPNAERIRGLVDTTIRPLSHTLWSVENQRYPEIRLGTLFRLSLETGRLPAVVGTVVWALLSIVALAAPLGPTANLVYHLASIPVALVVWRLAGRWIPRGARSGVVSIAVLSVLVLSVGAALTSWILGGIPDGLSPIVLTFGGVWMSFAIVGASMVVGARQMSALIQRDLASGDTQELIDSLADDTATEIATRSLATALHGDVQSRLLGLAAAIDQRSIGRAGIVAQLDEVIAAVEQLRKAQPDGQPGGQAKPGHYRWADVRAAWRGLLRIDIDQVTESVLEQLCESHPEVLELVREAITNAQRHGAASVVSIEIEQRPEGVDVTVSDNGYGPRGGTPGIGSALFDRYLGSEWSLQPRSPNGSTLRMLFSAIQSAQTPS